MAENHAILSDAEKTRIKYHLGYLVQDNVLSIGLGVPMATQPLFLVEGAMNRIPESAVGSVRLLVARLDKVECRLDEVLDYLVADKMGEMELAPDIQQRLESMYLLWAQRLADLLGVPLNPYSSRTWGGRTPINSRVVAS